LFNEAIELAAYKPVRVILLQREQCLASIQQGRDIDWADALGTQRNLPIVLASEGLMLFYILYTSETTGKPKGVVRDNGGHQILVG
jgi:propionyl-CoA synthetase